METWLLKDSDMGSYLECPKCGRKVGARTVVFADIDLHKCPSCGNSNGFDGIKLGRLYESVNYDMYNK